MFNTPYCQASFPGHWQNICPEEFVGSLAQTYYLPLIHRPWTQGNSGRPLLTSQQLAAAQIVFVAILFVFLCLPSKTASQNLGGLHFLSSEQSQRTPSEVSKSNHILLSSENSPNVELQELLTLNTRLKQKSEPLVHWKQHTASLQAHEACQTSMFPKDSIHPYIVILHPNWQQSCTASCQRVTNYRIQPHHRAGAARPPPQIPLWTLFMSRLKPCLAWAIWQIL